MSLFSGIDKVKPNTGADYLGEGRYYAFIKRIKRDRTRKRIEFIAIEMTILKVISPDRYPAVHRVGEQVSHLIMANNDYFLQNVKGAIAGIKGVDHKTITEDACEEIIGEGQPLSWRVVELHNREIRVGITDEEKEELEKIAKEKGKDSKEYQDKMEAMGKPFTLINYKRTLPADEILAQFKGQEDILDENLTNKELEFLLES